MREKDIVEFVKKEVEPLPPLSPYGVRYRVAATLTDDIYLPCVVIESAARTVDLAIKRFDQTRNATNSGRGMGYRDIVKTFVTGGNSVNHYDLHALSLSPFAIPLARMKEIGGETSMGWTEFYATMQDGQEFRFGTTFCTEFFSMPESYICSDITKIIPAVRGEKPKSEKIYREKPFFTCFVDGL